MNKEYNLTLIDIMKSENLGKYFTDEYEEAIFWLTHDEDNDLELIVVEDMNNPDLINIRIEDKYTLETIAKTMYREVEYIVW